MSLSSSRTMLRQSLPPVHSLPDFRARFQHCSPVCRFDRTPSQFRPRRQKSASSRACPSEAAVLFSPSFVALRLIPSPPLHRANLAPRRRLHAPRPAKLPVPDLAPLPLPTPLAHSAQTADTPFAVPPSRTHYPQSPCSLDVSSIDDSTDTILSELFAKSAGIPRNIQFIVMWAVRNLVWRRASHVRLVG